MVCTFYFNLIKVSLLIKDFTNRHAAENPLVLFLLSVLPLYFLEGEHLAWHSLLLLLLF